MYSELCFLKDAIFTEFLMFRKFTPDYTCTGFELTLFMRFCYSPLYLKMYRTKLSRYSYIFRAIYFPHGLILLRHAKNIISDFLYFMINNFFSLGLFKRYSNY